ncbi:MAG: Unknown protein [uncultured Sulfurovum sp.]|uniref:LTD domain-containing protein n=1 Tax=uncultured Sulfurovum sp. TaxID=269237 RepID=A0A6S6TCI4_9BACT|nr:MAG: Unknown protein [uncultured Sulfurovum sp.]
MIKKIILLFIALSLVLFAKAITPNLEYQKISSVGYAWTHVNLLNSYSDPIVVCSNVLPSKAHREAVVRVNNITSMGFDVKIQAPNDVDPNYSTDIYCIVSDEGSYTIPIKYEAHKVISRGTSGSTSPVNWNASNTENVSGSIFQTYDKPAVLGQVMSYNDNRFSTFWSFDCESRSNRPFQSNMADGICVGKHVGQIGETRNDETLGYIVAEAGVYELEDFSMAVDYGADSVAGVGNNPPYSYNLDKSYTHGVVTKEAEDGGNGGWSVLYGASPFGTSLDLAIDEETIAGDKTRTHTTENVAYWVFLEEQVNLAEIKINEVLYKQTVTGMANNEFIEFFVTKSGDLKNYLFTDQDEKSHHYRFPKHSVNTGDYVVLHIGVGTDYVDAKVHHFYQNSSQFLNDDGDDILLLKPSNTDVTVVDGVGVNAVPFDYMAYNNAGDSIPISQNGITTFWNSSYESELKNADKGHSFSLVPNAIDSDTSACWELTTSGNASDNGCSGYVKSTDANSDTSLTYSMGRSNTDVPNIKLEKTSLTIYDPVNIESNPKAIPGALVAYTISARNEGFGSTDANGIGIADSVPANMKLCVSSLSRCTEVGFVEGGVSSTLSLGSLEYSNNNGASFNYMPMADAEGFDRDVTNVRIKLNGSFQESDGMNHPSFSLVLKMGII